MEGLRLQARAAPLRRTPWVQNWSGPLEAREQEKEHEQAERKEATNPAKAALREAELPPTPEREKAH